MKSPNWLLRLKQFAARLETQTYALYYAYQDPRTPWYAKIFSALIVAYALSPIDLIPDFIPVLGYLDDLVIIPAGIWLAVKMIPPDIMRASQLKAEQNKAAGGRQGKIAAVVIAVIWVAILVFVGLWVYRALAG